MPTQGGERDQLQDTPHALNMDFFFFSLWPIFKVLIEFVTILLLSLLFFFLLQVMWDLSSLARE